MRLHFKTDTGNYINISTSPENWNDLETEYTPIAIDEAGYDELLKILDFNMIPYSADLSKTEAQHDREIKRVLSLQSIYERISAGEMPQATRCIDRNGHSHPRNKQLQRDIISMIILAYPEKNNSEIAADTGASRNTVRSCRENIAEYKALLNWVIAPLDQEGGEPWH